MFDGVTEKELKKLIDQSHYFGDLVVNITVVPSSDPKRWEVEVEKNFGTKVEKLYIDKKIGERRKYKSLERLVVKLRNIGITSFCMRL
jgi:hypothetical protein